MENQFEQEIDLREYILIMLKWKWLIIGLFIAAIAAAAVASSMMTPAYTVTARINLGNYGSSEYTDTADAARIMRSAVNLDKIAQELSLKQSGSQLRAKVKAAPVDDTSLMQLTMTSANPQQAADILNAILDSFQQQEAKDLADAQADTKEELDALNMEMAAVEKTIASAEKALSLLPEEQDLSIVERSFMQSTLYSEIRGSQETKRRLVAEQNHLENNLDDIKGSEITMPAEVPAAPVKPNTRLNIAIAAVLGLMVGVFLAFVLEFFRRNPLSEYTGENS